MKYKIERKLQFVTKEPYYIIYDPFNVRHGLDISDYKEAVAKVKRLNATLKIDRGNHVKQCPT